MIFVPFSLKMLHFLIFFYLSFYTYKHLYKEGWPCTYSVCVCGGGSVAPSLLSLFFFSAMVYIMYMLIITHSSNSSIHR